MNKAIFQIMVLISLGILLPACKKNSGNATAGNCYKCFTPLTCLNGGWYDPQYGYCWCIYGYSGTTCEDTILQPNKGAVLFWTESGNSYHNIVVHFDTSGLNDSNEVLAFSSPPSCYTAYMGTGFQTDTGTYGYKAVSYDQHIWRGSVHVGSGCNVVELN